MQGPGEKDNSGTMAQEDVDAYLGAEQEESDSGGSQQQEDNNEGDNQ